MTTPPTTPRNDASRLRVLRVCAVRGARGRVLGLSAVSFAEALAQARPHAPEAVDRLAVLIAQRRAEYAGQLVGLAVPGARLELMALALEPDAWRS